MWRNPLHSTLEIDNAWSDFVRALRSARLMMTFAIRKGSYHISMSFDENSLTTYLVSFVIIVFKRMRLSSKQHCVKYDTHFPICIIYGEFGLNAFLFVNASARVVLFSRDSSTPHSVVYYDTLLFLDYEYIMFIW